MATLSNSAGMKIRMRLVAFRTRYIRQELCWRVKRSLEPVHNAFPGVAWFEQLSLVFANLGAISKWGLNFPFRYLDKYAV